MFISSRAFVWQMFIALVLTVCMFQHARLQQLIDRNLARNETTAAQYTEQLLFEGFESGISSTNWPTNEDRNAAGNLYYWGLKSDCFKRTGSFSAFCCGAGGTGGSGRPCNNNYVRDMDTWLISRPLDFTNRKGELEFWYMNESETNLDLFRVYVLIGTNSYLVHTAPSLTSDYPNSWHKVQIDLSSVNGAFNVTGKTGVQIAFNFTSDHPTTTFNGTYLDDILVSASPATDVQEVGSDLGLPAKFSLDQNTPNPFNLETTIAFDLKESSRASIEVIDILGRVVAVLVDETLGAGTYRTTWDCTDASGNTVASGLYLYRFRAGGYVETRKMILLK